MTTAAGPRQRSFDDLGTPLHEVTFCVVDLETTGGSPRDCTITEVGAVKVRGGHCVGTFQTLVNPGQAIPPEISVLTGITEAMVLPAPGVETVLPSLLEFIGDDRTVVVGHNVRFDLGFLRAALERDGRAPLPHPWVDTAALARRLLADEVPNCRLGTLAERLRLPHRPSHRALDDALATADLLHLLLERAAGLGVLGIDDLLVLPKLAGHAQAAKLALTSRLPRTPGVYLFRDGRGEVLYVGKATNLRSRVRSYFSGDRRRKVGQLLRETATIDHVECANPLEAGVLEIRLIHRHEPRFNRQGKGWRRYVYVKLTLNERFPRLSIVRSVRDDGARYLGPLSSRRQAQAVVDAVETALPLRRCTQRRTTVATPCAPAQLGVAACPCSGATSPLQYAAIVEQAVRGLSTEPDLVLEPLRARMERLAADDRYEEAADVRDRAGALVGALRRTRAVDRLRAAGRIVVACPDGSHAEVHDGALVQMWDPASPPRLDLSPAAPGAEAATLEGLGSAPTPPLPRDRADEAGCIARYLDENSERLQLVRCEGDLTSPTVPLPSFEPRKPLTTKRDQ